MKHTKAHNTYLCALLFTLVSAPLPIGEGLGVGLFAQTPATFVKAGDGAEKVQEFFPGEHRARPVLGDYTGSGQMGLFCGGQDLGGDPAKWYADTRWGDLGDGTFANPILNADYSDPDVIRVGRDYYMTCSEFHYMGMPILHSTDLVNWEVIARVHDFIDLPGYSSMEKYGSGTWAPALRYHDGKFWIYVCTPGEGLFMTTAERPEGPWTKLYCVKNVGGWEDPCPFWDEDGQGYLGRSQLGGGPIYVHRLSNDGKSLLDEGRKVYEGPTAEGTKFFKKDGKYYLSIPEGGVGTGWQMVLRADNIYGPYTGQRALEQGTTRVNGPHQGAFVDTPEGEWWFYHFQDTHPLGRVVHLQPVEWHDGFPTAGTDYDGNGIGEPMKVCRKPYPETAASHPQTDDDFSSTTLAPCWQWNHNPDAERWSLTSHPGFMAMKASVAQKIRDARGQITQKSMGYYSQATVVLNIEEMTGSQRAGLECIGQKYNAVGIFMRTVNGVVTPRFYTEYDGTLNISNDALPEGTKQVWLRVDCDDVENRHQFSVSLDGATFTPLGDAFEQNTADWKGYRVGLYSYANREVEGVALFDKFEYKTDGPGKFESK